MKNLTLCILFLATCNLLSAQKATIKKHRFHVEYSSLPEHFVDPDKRTFDLKVTDTYLYDEDAILDALNIRGWTYSNDNSTVSAHLSVSEFRRGSPVQKTRVVEDKDKEGKVKSKTTYYYYESVNQGRARLRVYGPDNKYVRQEKDEKKMKEEESNPFLTGAHKDGSVNYSKDEVGDYGLYKDYIIKGKESTDAKKAMSNYRVETTTAYSTHKEEYFSFLISKTNEHLNKLYGYNKIRDYAKFKKLNSKKHPEYKMYRNATEAIKAIFAEKRFNKNHESIITALAPVEKYFADCADKYDGNDKHSKRLKSASLYNLAKCYYYTDRPELLIQTGQQFIDMGHDEKFGRDFIKKGKELKHLLEFHQRDGRYFETDEDSSLIEAEEVDTDDEGGR